MRPLISYYGDDFTGSTDVMEALASHGIKAVLFTRKPTVEEFAPYEGYQAFGLAGTSRSETPEWMDQNLPGVFRWLQSLKARYCHYKVCSTFDSSPQIGSIGRAIDIGAEVFGQALVPLIVGAPQLKRYTFGGNLFAGYQGKIYRLDRHPVMSCHPVTPMDEADVRLHLAKQTLLPVVLVNDYWPKEGVGLLDVHDDITQLQAGNRLLDWFSGFVTGSSGVEYALTLALSQRREITGRATFPPLMPVPQTVVVSGSVSPTTERQIRHALNNGFDAVAVDPIELARGGDQIQAQAIEAALTVLSCGRSPVIHTALGPTTDDSDKLSAVKDGRKKIGEGLGAILKALQQATKIRRVLIAGGDSSSHAIGQLDIYAITTRMPLPATPGSPLCTAASSTTSLNGIEIAMKRRPGRCRRLL